jgi:ABC-type phosphate transport system auxiliary subunit
MFKLSDQHKKKLQKHGEKISQKLTDLTFEGHHHKLVLHDKNGVVVKFPLLLVIIVTLIFPILVALLLLFFLIYGGNLVLEREK